ncbi:choline O-acetyltransferase [Epargyreus clarus]|uniref:choline O-acetyltransferase n=1 Tax=Epargyreus clarus TaxID=520877 RepID=UPI003C2C0B56
MPAEAFEAFGRGYSVWARGSQVCQARANGNQSDVRFVTARGAVAPWGLIVEDEGGALLGRLQGALRGSAAAASPSRVASSIKGYLSNKVGSLQLRDTGWGESLLSLPKKWLSTQVYGTEDEDFQDVQLPKLPVPDLQATMDSYLDFASVIVNQQQLENTQGLVKTFMEDLGPKLQNLLLDRQKETNNWVTEWWLDDMYLKVRLPLPINSNPGMVFPKRSFAKMDEVADLGALFVDDLLDYKEMLDRGELPLERATSREKGQPLCMEQFYRLLGVCRIPEVGRDRLELPKMPGESGECEELIVVACRNYFYPIPVKAADRGRLTPGEIQAQLLHAMVDAAGAPPAPKIGILTTMNRDHWARAREHLIKDEMNRMNMELISRALCILCLDEASGDRGDADADTNAMLRAMHGAGTRHHSANRWFDKTVQLIISSDGTVGMCYEHSAAEGVAVIRLAERALARAEVADRPAPPPALLPAPQAMKWTLGQDVQRTIDRAAREFDRQISDLDFKVYTYRGYGREFMKSCRTSPDVYIQLAIQYAYYKMYGYLVSTYESASLRRFRNGRVDNIRSAHGAARRWAAAMCAAETPPLGDDDGQKKVSFNLYGEQKKLELFDEAARKQTAIMEANILGRGIDNHLLGLREAARESTGELPPLFTDPTYKQMIEFKLSTSQVATTTDGTFMGYGAVVPDGYGCSYNPKKDCVIFCISSFSSSSVTNTEAFRLSLEEALDSMKLMFQNRKVET